MTLLEIINAIYTRIRQEQLTAVDLTDPYQALTVEKLNDVKRAVEERWDWRALREEVTLALVPGTSVYALDTEAFSRARLVSPHEEAVQRQAGPLLPASSSAVKQWSLWPMSGRPERFTLQSDATGLKVRLYPTPSAAENLVVHLVRPTPKLALATDTVKVPPHLLVLGGTAAMMAEDGQDPTLVAATFADALGTAITADQAHGDTTDQDWRPV